MPNNIDWTEVQNHLESYVDTSKTDTVVIPTKVLSDAINCIDNMAERIERLEVIRFGGNDEQ